MEEALSNVLLILFLGEVLLSLFAYAKILAIYREEQGWRSILWRTLVRVFGVAVTVGLLFSPVAIGALLDLPQLPLTGPGITLGVMLLLSGVIVFWAQIERLRSQHPMAEGERRDDDASSGEKVRET